MNQSELQHQEMSRILALKERIEKLNIWLQKGYLRTLDSRQEAWATVFREADKQLVALQQAKEPQVEQIPLEGTK